MKLKSAFLIVSFLVPGILASLHAAPQPDEGGWLSLGGDFRRSGSSQNVGPAAGSIKWTFETGGPVVGSVTVGSDGRIHVASEDGKLYSLNAEGQPEWILDVNTPLLSSPSIGPDGSLYVGGRDGRLYAVDPDGRVRWTHSTGGAIYSSPAVAADGAVYVGSTDGILYALAADGAELWQFATKGPGVLPTGAIFASPALAADGTVYIAGLYDPNLYALDPGDGSVKWACHFGPASSDSADEEGGWPFAAPVVAEDGTIYQTLLYDSRLHAIDPNDGRILWSADLLDPESGWSYVEDPRWNPDADGWSEPALGPDGTIYVSFDDPYLRAVTPDGTLEWATPLGEVGGFTLTADVQGWVYATGDDGNVYLVADSGLQIDRFEIGGWLAYPVIAADGTLIVADARDYSDLNTDAASAVYVISSEPDDDDLPRR